jgi:tRNA nucleotidyltransferase (CCA-adding enzyme)
MEKTANRLLDKLHTHGYEAYLVGGCVRDRILHKPIQDIDIATNALPQQVMELFSHTIPTGLQHGTVTVLLDGIAFEVTTYRKESSYIEHRRPLEVDFVSSLHEDLQRRDFTMNAMAMEISGVIIDPFNGQADLSIGLIRCVGNPQERFEEDALRMLRCIRFAANYSLRIEQATWTALTEHIHLLKFIAMERVRVELEKMMAGDHPYHAFELLLEAKLLQHLKQELQLPLVKWQPDELPPYLMELTKLEDPNLRWALLFLSMQISSDKANRAMKKLTLSSKQIKAVLPLLNLEHWLDEQIEQAIREHQSPEKVEPVSLSAARLSVDRPVLIWKRAAVQFGKSALLGWLQLKQIETMETLEGQSIDMKQAIYAAFLDHGVDWISEMPVETLAELDIIGSDLVEHFELTAGPWVSEVLHRLLLDAAFGNARNQKSHLLQRAEIYRKELNKP